MNINRYDITESGDVRDDDTGSWVHYKSIKHLVDPNTLKQTFIIFLNNDEVYCTTDSYELANQIVEVDGLNDAVIKQVNHYTGFDTSISSYDCTSDNVNDVRHKDHY